MNRPVKGDPSSPGYHSSLIMPVKLPESIIAASLPAQRHAGLERYVNDLKVRSKMAAKVLSLFDEK